MCQSLDQIANCWDNRMRNDILYFPCFLLIRLRGWSEQEIQKITLLRTKRIATIKCLVGFCFKLKLLIFSPSKIHCHYMPYLTDQREKDSEMNVSFPIFLVSAD